MKKFFLLLLLKITILVSVVQAQTADVPDFQRFVGNGQVNFDGQVHEKGYRVYKYHVGHHITVIAEQYVDLLKQRGLNCIGHEVHNWRDGYNGYASYRREEWIFSCKGKRVKFSLYVDFDQRTTEYAVQVEEGLTYAGD